MKIGLIQTRGIGDIVIALPIAQELIAQGHEVFWPIDHHWVDDFVLAEPAVHWFPVVSAPNTGPYLIEEPLARLTEAGCESSFVLYSRLSGHLAPMVANAKLAASLKFDEYKYAVCGMPFELKWRLRLRRRPEAEERLFASLGLEGAGAAPYAVLHLEGSNLRARFDREALVRRGLRVVEIKPGVAGLFDWLTVIDRAAELVMLDSVYANVVEQLALAPRAVKSLILRSPCGFTPVYAKGWRFIGSLVPD